MGDEERKEHEKEHILVMPEEPDSARSSVLKSLSDSQMVQPPVKSQSCRGLFIEEMSFTEGGSGEKMWILLANTVDEELTVIFTCEEIEKEVDGILQRDKLLIFTIPYFSPENDTEGTLSVKSSASRTITIPFVFKKSSDSSVSATLDSDHLFQFADSGDSQVLVKPFVDHLAKQDNEGNTVLHVAARNQQSYAMKVFLNSCDGVSSEKKKALLNRKNARGQTALQCAIRSGDVDSVHYLMREGAAVNLEDNHKNTALHYLGDAYNDAIFKEVLEQSELSIENDLEKRNDEGLTPLHIAVKRLKLSLIEMLLDAGAKVDETDEMNRTPLMHAILMNDPEIVNFFIQRGSNVNHEDSSGETPLLLTKQMSNMYMMGALLDAGANPENKNCKGIALNDCEEEEVKKVLNGERIAPDFKLKGPHIDGQIRPALFGKSVRNGENEDSETDEEREGIYAEELPGSSRTLSSVNDPIRIPMSTSFDESDEEQEEVSAPQSPNQPSTSSHERRTRKSRFETKSFVKDDISSLDYLTRLRLSKYLDDNAKWQDLANSLNCGHMIELIEICVDEHSSPTMIFMDQYEQLPGASITLLRQSLNNLSLEECVQLIDNRMIL